MASTAGRWRTALTRFLGLGSLLGAVCVLGALGTFSGAALAHDDPPGRVGRLADFNGGVSWWDNEAGQWADADRNRPLTSGDRVSTAASGRAELRVGSTTLRLGNRTELEVLRLDDVRMVFQLHSGSLALRVRSREIATEIEVMTTEARLLPQRAGLYRVDRDDGLTQAGVWRGEWRVGEDRGPQIGAGQRAEISRNGRRGAIGESRMQWIEMPRDGFDSWVMAEDAGDERVAVQRYVAPEMTGAEDLDRHGRWEQHPEFGAVWSPLQVSVGWAPYRYGRWSWVAPWGWTWVDDAPWGFAPFHYGRWVSWRERWCWVPGAYVARPVYAPALVAWVGGGGLGASVRIGGPTVGWVPLSPREAYHPHYRATPVYVERVNPTPPWRWQPRHDGPVHYGNQGVPNGVTVVPSEVLTNRQPVPRGMVALPERGRGEQAPWQSVSPPSGPQRQPDGERPRGRGEFVGREPGGREPGAREPVREPIRELLVREPMREPMREPVREPTSRGEPGGREPVRTVPPQVQPPEPQAPGRGGERDRRGREERDRDGLGGRDARDRDAREPRRGREITPPLPPMPAPVTPPPMAAPVTPPPAVAPSPTPRPPPAASPSLPPMAAPVTPPPAVAPSPTPRPPPAAAPSPPPAGAPSPPPRPPAAERPREPDRPRDRDRERDDERKRKPESTAGARERENQR